MLLCKKHLFNLEEGVVYLNMAYMSPLLKSSVDIGINHLKLKSRPYQIDVDDFFEPVNQLKQSFCELVDAHDPEAIAIIPSISYAMANAAKNIPFNPGEEIIVIEGQFPSNIYPWRKLVSEKNGKIITVPSPSYDQSRVDNWTERILDKIYEKTRIAALPHVHWSDGTKLDLKAIREKLDRFDAFLIIDGTQSIGALPFSIKEIRPDVLAVASYKWLLGPYGMGVAYYNERFFDGSPIEDSWMNRRKSDNFSQLVEYEEEYRPGASRYSVGESSNFSHIPMINHGIRQILDWGVQNIQNYCKNITCDALYNLSSHGFTTIPTGLRGGHLFGISIPEHIPPKKLALFLKGKDIHISVRGSFIRVSPYVYNTKEDMNNLSRALIEAAALF